MRNRTNDSRFETLFHCRELGPAVSEAMLTAVHQTINSQVFQDVASRNLFIPTCCDILKKYLGLKAHLGQCADILGDMLTFFHLRHELTGEGTSVIFKDILVMSEKLSISMISTILNLEGISNLKVS